jgi:hypothetical protein
MQSRSNHYRRLGIEAQGNAAKASDRTIREGFDQIAKNWFALAEQAEWLDNRVQPKPTD